MKNPKRRPSSQKNSGSIIMGVGAILLVAASLYEPEKRGQVEMSSSHPVYHASENSKEVTRYLQEFERKKELSALQQEIENSKSAPALHSTAPVPNTRRENFGVDMDQEFSGDHIADDIRGASSPADYSHPETQVEAELMAISNDYKEAEQSRKEYVQQFIANAARDGIVVKVDDDGNIVQVKSKKQNKGFLVPRELDSGPEYDDSTATANPY